MKKVVAIFAVMGLVSLVGCGGTANSCSGPSSDPAPVANQSIGSCTLQAGATATIQVQLCPNCSDVSPSCQAEFVNGEFELATAFQTCDETRSCPLTNSCGLANNAVTCTISNVPAASATYNVMVISDHAGGFRSAGTITVVPTGGTTSCSI
ncbi:MAG TPA: hypothetical protein VFE30_09640 [Anaeromyxobacteraceae bacterium]|jgi:hypothetical protein|nr:hypothetical protein [Anaeromyxobacteraceae bacterium]